MSDDRGERAMGGKRMSRRERLAGPLRGLGRDLATWSPGDGVTRYRVVPEGESYHGTDGPTALGARAAEAMVDGYRAGWMDAERRAREEALGALRRAVAWTGWGWLRPYAADGLDLYRLVYRAEGLADALRAAVLLVAEEKVGRESA